MQFYAEHAMSTLRDAVAKGYKDVAQLEKDKDLDPLRQREDFKQLAELKLKYPPSDKSSGDKPEPARVDRLRQAVVIIAGWPAVR